MKIAKPFIKKRVKKYLDDPDTRDTLVDLINEKLDIPNVSEEMEEEYLKTQYDLLNMIIMDFVEDL